MALLRVLVIVALLAPTTTAHGTHHHDDHAHDHHHHDEHDHHHHDDDDHDHGLIDLTAKSYAEMVVGDEHVWVVKFYSGMCGACASFAPAFDEARVLLHGLHWAQLNIDDKENMSIAKKLGVLNEGIPNVKIMNAAEAPLSVVSGDTPTATDLVKSLQEKLLASSAGGNRDPHGFYVSSASRTEL